MRETVPGAVQDCDDLLRWLIPHLDKFPRARRFTPNLEDELIALQPALREGSPLRRGGFPDRDSRRAAGAPLNEAGGASNTCSGWRPPWRKRSSRAWTSLRCIGGRNRNRGHARINRGVVMNRILRSAVALVLVLSAAHGHAALSTGAKLESWMHPM